MGSAAEDSSFSVDKYILSAVKFRKLTMNKECNAERVRGENSSTVTGPRKSFSIKYMCSPLDAPGFGSVGFIVYILSASVDNRWQRPKGS